MAINPLSGAGSAGVAGAGAPQKAERFSQVMKDQGAPQGAPSAAGEAKAAAQPAQSVQSAQTAQAGTQRVGGPQPVADSREATAARVIDQVSRAQDRMEAILKVAESGKSFSPAELLSLQTHVYRASQELDLAGKVVEKATGGVKQVLQTQV